MPIGPPRRRQQVARRVQQVLGAVAAPPGEPVERTVRWDPGRRGVLVTAGVALLAVLVTLVWVWAARPRADAVAVSGLSAASPGAGSGADSSPADSPGLGSSRGGSSPAGSPVAVRPAASVASTAPGVVVDVVGRVRHPGVYRFAGGARVDDAVRAAGGALPGTDLTTLNLARVLQDGEQVAVDVTGAPDAAAPPGTGSSGSSAGSTVSSTAPVDLNSATADQLDALPGVGPVLAQNILDWRAAHGRFDSVDQLTDVTGIGPSKFAQLRTRVAV